MPRIAYTKVLIIDDQPLYTMGLITILESQNKFNIIGVASTNEDAIQIMEKEKPKVIILELRLGNENTLELITKIKLFNPEIAILILSANDERFYSERVLRLGARGYLMKNADKKTVLEAIYTVMEGKVYLSINERDRILQAMTGDSSRSAKDWTVSLQKLSDRELQVFTLIGKGYGTIEIASRFNISTKTIDSHKEHIKLKLHCNTSQELRQLAIEWTNRSGKL